jgi:NAD(P)-dependent dehydrogenase (short-subunit alcohol dehydrogenase family)
VSGVLAGRAALITGASQGLGLEIARANLADGASVFLCARDDAALAAAAEQLAPVAIDGAAVGFQAADISDRAAVRSLVAAAVARFPGLSILVNNAGVYGPMGAIDEVDWDEWVRAVEINLFGSVLVARELISQLRAVGGGKIIQLSGGGATQPLEGLSSYGASKSAIVRFMETLALELADDHVDVNAIAPGAMNTRMLDELLAAGPEAVGEAFYAKAIQQRDSGGTPPAKGGELAVWLGSAASNGVTGKLLSAVWDPYREFDAHREDLATDIYTLRRIIPSDRGMDWGD